MSQFLPPSVRSVRYLLLILRLKLLRLDLPRSAGLSLPHKWGPKKRSECNFCHDSHSTVIKLQTSRYSIESRCESLKNYFFIWYKCHQHLRPDWIDRRRDYIATECPVCWVNVSVAVSHLNVVHLFAVIRSLWTEVKGLEAKLYAVTAGHSDCPAAFHVDMVI